MDKIMRYAGPSAEAQLINPVIERYERYNKYCYSHPFFNFCFYERKKLLRDIYNENLRRKMEEQEIMTQHNIQKKSWHSRVLSLLFIINS